MIAAWLDPMMRWDEWKKMRKALWDEKGPILVFGLSQAQKHHCLSSLLYPLDRQCLYITYSDAQAKKICQDLNFYLEDKAMVFPSREILFYDVAAHSTQVISQRLRVLESLLSGEAQVVVASVEALLSYQTPKDKFKNNMMKLELGQEISIDYLSSNMVGMGYERVSTVEGPGQFSIRGGIIDVFSMTSKSPYRIEFFGDEIDSIRLFDPLSQRSTDNVEAIAISPAKELILSEKVISAGMRRIKEDLAKVVHKDESCLADKISALLESLEEGVYQGDLANYFPFFYPKGNTLLDYMDSSALIVLDEPARIRESAMGRNYEFQESFKELLQEQEVLPGQGELYISYEELLGQFGHFNQLALQALPRAIEDYAPRAIYNIASRSITPYHGKFDLLVEDIQFWRDKAYSVVIHAGSASRGEGLVENLYGLNIESTFKDDGLGPVMEGQVVVVPGTISAGFEYPEGRVAILSDSEVYGSSKERRRPPRAIRKRRKLDPFMDLRIGDYVVHEAHGVGKYLGIETLVINDQKKDYLNIQYGGTDKLYIPTEQVDIIQPYISMDNRTPRLSKLGGNEWKNAKSRVRQSVKELALDLVELYATREASKGYRFSEDTPWQRQFEDLFPYEETPDQESSIKDIKNDMERERVMDRLLCGDVGYGKTEVAIRAAFKAVMDGKQVAVLAPTTILAQQHFNTFINRFEDFPVKVQVISRFRTPAQQRDILKAVKQGNVDILVGTHRLLSKDVIFKDLGLLIVDEEQRFGVGHKESIKNLKKNLDVLTLTATPIPRTLHMSLMGIRDISTIETPPEDRYPVQTYVVEYNDSMIRDAILRETQRGGQVYFVYNKVKSMERMAERLRNLVPEIKIRMGHGQMGEAILEKVMMDFYDGEFDLLICSTIIESGLDIPNVNTIIVYDADYYGLSQLYQLRGRVGRSNRRAYAYLTYRKDKILTEVAEKRLQAIKEFTEFGAGFKIAMRDLEIRGSGNILGPQQHGHMTSVGYELYCKLLDEAVKSLKGEEPEETIDTLIDIKVNAHIYDEYIPLEGQKIEIYKKIAAIENLQDKYDVEDELEDRFGEMPIPLRNLVDIAYIKAMAGKAGILEIIHREKEVVLRLSESQPLDPRQLMILLNENPKNLKFQSFRQPSLKIILKDTSPSTALVATKDILEQLDTKLRHREGKKKSEK